MNVFWKLVLVVWFCTCSNAFVIHNHKVTNKELHLVATSTTDTTKSISQSIQQCWEDEAKVWTESYLFDEEKKTQDVSRLLYSIFQSLIPYMSVSGTPLFLPSTELPDTCGNYFTSVELQEATDMDFLDATRGSTDPRKGWQVHGVSSPTGTSMQEAKMSYRDVTRALEKGTVIYNSIGAHIPRLGPLCLACCDATNLPNAVNLYLTSPQKKTSAPPHTDRQDVVIVQQTGSKRWRVFAPPNPSIQPHSDPFARGKLQDALPLHKLADLELLDITLNPGDILFIPAGYPHTTDTLTTTTTTSTDDDSNVEEEPSLHLTFNFDSHVWDLNYLSLRQYALMRANVEDTGLSPTNNNKYTGNVNLLPMEVWQRLLQHLPLELLHPETTDDSPIIDTITSQLEVVSQEVDVSTYEQIPKEIWKETVLRVRQEGLELLDVHRDMYLAAMKEGSIRRSSPLTEIPPHRLSIFRVEPFYKQVDVIKQQLLAWATSSSSSSSSGLPDDWAITVPLSVGDQVEADLGGAYFPASITSVNPNNTYKVTFFDGDVEILPRDMIHLLTPPKLSQTSEDEPPPGLTPKEIKRWRKKMEKKNK